MANEEDVHPLAPMPLETGKPVEGLLKVSCPRCRGVGYTSKDRKIDRSCWLCDGTGESSPGENGVWTTPVTGTMYLY